ncbi:hypothetical protein AVEN_14591-1 [Araneus ventricosus]|uniref:Uncharacterized protein n=1 Tax=Araneus ventricosus TaxID=182803 RepID=A0A4Y2CII1_ARAVE|nr:hypothetical protein AVEN_14591-1 [Araneus ventricosus]
MSPSTSHLRVRAAFKRFVCVDFCFTPPTQARSKIVPTCLDTLFICIKVMKSTVHSFCRCASLLSSRLPLKTPSCHLPHNFSFLASCSTAGLFPQTKTSPFNQPVGSSPKSPEVSSLSKLPHPHNSSDPLKEIANGQPIY